MNVKEFVRRYGVVEKPKGFQVDRSVKTIEVNACEWFDKVNGNSYFSAQVIVNAGAKNEIYFTVPFTYGYGEHYRGVAAEALHLLGVISGNRFDWDGKYKVFTHIQKGCKKRDVVAHGK